MHRIPLASSALLGLGMALAVASQAAAAVPEMALVRPSNSGIPGEEIRVVRWAPDGKLWVAARWPFWQEGGIGVYDRETQRWRVWSSFETPIPSEYINDLEFDHDGVAWIATNKGLVRWDGKTWKVFDPANSPLRLDTVQDIAIAPNNHVWVNNSSFSGGGDAIYDFDGVAGWTRYAVPDQLPWPAPWTDLSQVFVASNGHVWVANENLPGAAEYDGTSWTKRGESLGLFDEMAEDQLGNIWLNANGVGGDYAYYRWNGTSFTRYGFYSPTTLFADPEDGTVYFGNWGGEVQRTRDGGQTIETYLTGLNQVYSIAPDPAGPDVWIGTIGAVGHFRDDSSWVRDYNTYNSGIPDFWIDRMTTDRDGYFWFASGEAGLSRFDGARWRNWGAHNAGSEPYPFAGNEPMGTAYLARDGVHWFGGNGIARWHSASGQFDGFWNWQNNPGMGVGLWIYFAEDAAGHLFAIEKYGSTYRFDPPSQLWLREPVQPYAVLGVPGMQADSAGDVWIAAWFDIHKWDGTSWSKVVLPYPDYFFDLGGINTLAIGPDDVLWLGTNEGLVRWDGQQFTLYDRSNTPLPYPAVQGVAVRADGTLGLSAIDFNQLQGGASFIQGDIADPANWTSYLWGSSPLPHWQLGAVAFDPAGDLWVSALSEGTAVIRIGGSRLSLMAPDPGSACVTNTWRVTGAAPGQVVYLAAATARGTTAVPGCPGVELGIGGAATRLLGSAPADGAGVARLEKALPCGAQGRQLFFQAVDRTTCALSAVVASLIE